MNHAIFFYQISSCHDAILFLTGLRKRRKRRRKLILHT